MSAAAVYRDLLNGRMAEWLTATVTLAIALTLALPGDTLLVGRAFRALADLGVTEMSLAIPTAAIGAARMAALYVNGQWRRTPSIRMAGAMLGAGMFGFLSVGTMAPYLTGSTPAPTIVASILAVLAAFDIIAAYRSSHDAKLLRV